MKPWLVVEDEEDIRTIVKVMFQVWGHSAIEFRDGHEAWNWLDSVEAGRFSDELPELALMDIRMPGHKGHEIARRIRSVKALETIPIVLMTAFSLSENERKEMLHDYGVDHIIHKPLPDFFEMKKLLEDAHARKKAQAASGPAAPASDRAPSGDQAKLPAGDPAPSGDQAKQPGNSSGPSGNSTKPPASDKAASN